MWGSGVSTAVLPGKPALRVEAGQWGAGWQQRHRAQPVLRWGEEWGFQPQSLAVNSSQTHGKVHPLTPSSSQLPQEVAENSDRLSMTWLLMEESVCLSGVLELWSLPGPFVPGLQHFSGQFVCLFV